MSGKTIKILKRFTRGQGYNETQTKVAKKMLRQQNVDNRTVLLKEMRQFENEQSQE